MTEALSCADCHKFNCQRANEDYPAFCPTGNTDPALVAAVKARYQNDPDLRQSQLTAAAIESEFYNKATRLEEILHYIKRMGYQKVGVATCMGLIRECATFREIAASHGIETFSVACKVGSVDKTEAGLPEEQKIRPGKFEAMCNPVLQAEILNRAGTDFNVIIGLCVGHDTQFIKHSQAPVTYFVVKDRVLCHNPAAALYNAQGYYKKVYGDQK